MARLFQFLGGYVDNLNVQEKEKTLGGELHTRTSPSGQVVSSCNLPSIGLTLKIQVPLTMIGGSGVRKMQAGLNGRQVVKNRMQAMHGWRLTRAFALLEANSIILWRLERPWS